MLADGRERAAKGEHPLVLGLVADGTPARMIPILLASFHIAPGRLDVAARIGGDPDVGPGGRDHQRGDPRQRCIVTHGVPSGRV